MQAKYSLSWKCQLNIMRKVSKQRNYATEPASQGQAINNVTEPASQRTGHQPRCCACGLGDTGKMFELASAFLWDECICRKKIWSYKLLSPCRCLTPGLPTSCHSAGVCRCVSKNSVSSQRTKKWHHNMILESHTRKLAKIPSST